MFRRQMAKNRSIFLSFIMGAAAFLALACEEHNGFYSFDKKGVVRGMVHRNSSFLHNNISVSLKGASYSKVVITDETGGYEFVNVPTSNYEIDFAADGYGSTRLYNLRQSGIDTLYMQNLLLYSIPQQPVKAIEDFYANVTSSDEPYIYLNFTDQPNLADGRIFFSLSPDVSYLDYEVSAHIDRQVAVDFQRIFFNEVSVQRFRGFKKVYFKIYPNGGGAYFDYSKDLWIHSAVNPELASSIYEFTFPI
jgi:hypothetical protein